ncbi:MAG TPA: metal-sensitive transcriptional regulator [Dehalococcoidia bacterium]|nr:metal-sensitive transcriptional regulator [Dehalococcoidia bacterium]
MEQNPRDETEALLSRLRRIEGQVRGIHRMLEEGRVCEDILTQLMAVRSGLDRVGLLIMDRHVEQCLAAGLEDSARRNLQQAMRNWMRFGLVTPSEDADAGSSEN